MTEHSEGTLGAATAPDPTLPDPTPEDPTPEERRALFRVVRGEPTHAELAALTVVLAAATSGGAPAEPGPRSAWNDPAARVRRALPVGPGAWHASTWPR